MQRLYGTLGLRDEKYRVRPLPLHRHPHQRDEVGIQERYLSGTARLFRRTFK